jgi:hypothetical protein
MGASETEATTLREYYARLDGSDPSSVLDLLAPDYAFTIVFVTDAGEAIDFSGGRKELEDYLAQRDGAGLRHHALVERSSGPVELMLGMTTQDGAPLATFMNSVELDEQARVRRSFAARSPSLSFDSLRNQLQA